MQSFYIKINNKWVAGFRDIDQPHPSGGWYDTGGGGSVPVLTDKEEEAKLFEEVGYDVIQLSDLTQQTSLDI